MTGGHTTEALAPITYASILSREAVRIAFIISALNDLEVNLGNILNANVEAPGRIVVDYFWS